MDSNLRLALDNSALRQFTAVRVVLADGYRINLIDGSGEVSFLVNGTMEIFDGSDPTFGSLATCSSLQERIADQGPRFGFTLMPPTAAAIGTLANPVNQGCSVMAFWGLVNELTGDTIGTPETLWLGRMDNVKTLLAEGSTYCEVDSVSAFDRLFVAEEGARLTPVFHRSMWPDESGLDFNSAALASPYWGVDGGRPAVVQYSGGGGGGGGGGFYNNVNLY